MSKRCPACGRLFRPHPQAPHQSYCSAPECQRERRRLGQMKKRGEYLNYRENVSDRNRIWSLKNPECSKRYRENHTDYVERNRSLQQIRNLMRQAVIANEDAWIVEITFISNSCNDSGA